MSRFDSVKYDAIASETLSCLRKKFDELDELIEYRLTNGRSKSVAMTHLEECLMWVGKAIRDDQLRREFASKIPGTK